MNDLLEGILQELKQPDRRPISEWAADGNVILPHSKRCREFRLDTAPWLLEPLDSIPFNEFSSICKCTQGGGTTVYEVYLAWLIANAPVDASLACQTDPDAERMLEEKILPTLKASPATVAALAAAGRNDITKNKIKLGNMVFRVHGVGLNSLQSASLEVFIGDECWRFDLGTILEIIERTSTREATRQIVMVSQAGEEEVDKNGRAMWDEWGEHWHKGTQEIYKVRCPHCPTYFEIETSHVTADEVARDPKTKVWDWTKVRATAKLTTPCCNRVIRNTEANRRALSASGKYFATNPNPTPRHRSFRFSAWVVYWQDWGGLLEMFLRAQDALQRGNIEPLKIWTQKKEARWWELRMREAPVISNREPSGYTQATYWPFDKPYPKNSKDTVWGKQLEKEKVPRWSALDPETQKVVSIETGRLMTIDRQTDCLKVVIRVYSPLGSRLLLFRTVYSWAQARELQLAYRVPNSFVGADSGDQPQDVYEQCHKYGWFALRGSSSNRWKHPAKRKHDIPLTKPYSPPQKGDIARSRDGAFAWYHDWSNLVFKDILSYKVARDKSWEIPDDAEEEYQKSLHSEAKDSKTGIYKKVGERPNHAWDGENMQLVLACLTGTIADIAMDLESTEDEEVDA